MTDVRVEIDPGDFRQLVADIRAFDKAFYAATRKRLREAADPMVKDVKARLMSRPHKQDVGLARGLAAGTKVSIKTGVRLAGVSITTTGAKLPADKRILVKAFNQKTIRHPTFGHRTRWVNQDGRPYFGAVLDGKRQEGADAVNLALADAAATIHAGQVSP